MKIDVCDICGDAVKERAMVKISGALAEIAGAEHVCQKCWGRAKQINWREVVHQRGKEAQK